MALSSHKTVPSPILQRKFRNEEFQKEKEGMPILMNRQSFHLKNQMKMGCGQHSRISTSLSSTINSAVFTASLSATAKLLSSIGLGAVITPSGPIMFGRVLDDTTVTSLSKLTYWLFQPCFLFCGVATTLAKATSPGSNGLPKNALFLMPIASILQIGLGSITGKIITTKKFGIRQRLLGIEEKDDESANDIKMCTTFANSGPLPLILSEALFGRSSADLLTDVNACVSFYLLAWSPLFWTFGRVILGTNKKSYGSSCENTSRTQIFVTSVKNISSPPVMGSILGVMIGSNPLLRNLLVNPKGLLSPLFGAMNTLGSAYLPAVILVLAGSLVGSPKVDTSTIEKQKGNNLKNEVATEENEKNICFKTIVTLLVSRFLLSPIMAATTLYILSCLNLLQFHSSRTLSIVIFTLMMEGCMPPAQNSVIILQLDGKKERAAKMAKLLTIMYSVSTLPVTLLLGWCLSTSEILNF
jgi:predicted permease